MHFDVHLPVRVSFGEGVTGRIRELCSDKRVMIVTTGLKRSQVLDRILKDVGSPSELIVYRELEPNPSCDSIDRGARIARESRVDVIIALGGGSALDAAKGVACLRDEAKEVWQNSGGIRDYLFREKTFLRRSTLLIAIPTTSGTGSEVTNVGVFSDHERHMKQSMVSPFFWSDYAFIDPSFTLTVPEKQTAATGLDAFIHALESFWATTATPISSVTALEALRLIIENLETAYRKPDEMEARTNLSLGSLLAGIAFSQTRTTVLHAVSYPLTSWFNLEHGFACSVMVIPILKANIPFLGDRIHRLLTYLNNRSVEEFIRRIESLMISIKAPTSLKEIGVKEEDCEKIAEYAVNSPLTKLNPNPLTKESLLAILKEET
jgi:alcohol dehydrogenase